MAKWKREDAVNNVVGQVVLCGKLWMTTHKSIDYAHGLVTKQPVVSKRRVANEQRRGGEQ